MSDPIHTIPSHPISLTYTPTRTHTLHSGQWAYHAVAEKLWANSTLVVWGDLDEVTPFGHSKTVMRILGPEKARLVVLPECGHVDALEVPRSIDDMMDAVLPHLS
jgi:pimeloyl-ACP methyl ester carboxylesterase